MGNEPDSDSTREMSECKEVELADDDDHELNDSNKIDTESNPNSSTLPVSKECSSTPIAIPSPSNPTIATQTESLSSPISTQTPAGPPPNILTTIVSQYNPISVDMIH